MTSIGDVCTYLAIAGPVKAARTVNNALRIDLVRVQKVANQRSQVVLLHIRRNNRSKLFVSSILVWVSLNDRRKKIGQRKREEEKPIPYVMRDMTEAERAEFEAKKAAREKEREENLAQIAPSAATAQKQKNPPKPKTQQVMKADMTAEEIAKARVKYEEALPWHMEDFDNKNTWVGNYEAALSETYAMFVLESTGKMRMVPIDKWYRFNARTAFKTLTIEEAEKFMSKKIKDPR